MRTKQEILKELIPEEKDLNFKVDKFEELILNDIAQYDEDTRNKLNRPLTKDFNNWLNDKIKAKEQIKLNIKGETRSGKSLIGLKIMLLATNSYKNKIFDVEKIVCANQKELRIKLNNAEFGDSFLIDENAFANVGMGSMTEIQQLKDINNIIAKQNIHMVYITPQTFLLTGATMGLSYFGKDVKHWTSRFLLYSLKGGNPSLLGYVVFDVGALYRSTGCLIYNQIGGCNNPKGLKIDEIGDDYILNSDCINEDVKLILKQNLNKNKSELKEDLDKSKVCPFYEKCKSQMCKYEHKKDKWIEREMKGGFGERELEKYELCIDIFLLMITFDEKKGGIRLKAKNGKELESKIKMKLPTLTNTKFTGVEIKDIVQNVINLIDDEFLRDTCKVCDIDYNKIQKKISSSIG